MPRHASRPPRGTGSLNVSDLLPLVHGYTIDPGPPRTITLPQASRLADLQMVTVDGTLQKKEHVILDRSTGRRSVALGAQGGRYETNPDDGDLHFCLGDRPLDPFLTCELQNGQAWLATFNGAVGKPIAVGGFFRCLFEHPGFNPLDDAHLFEIHPVRAVGIGGQLLSFAVDVPEQKSIHTWTDPHPLNDQDGRIRVAYHRDRDTLVFTGMDGQDENYVRVSGNVGDVKLNASGGSPASFTLTSAEIGHPVEVLALQGTTAARQLRQLKASKIVLVGLRNVDLRQALQGRYQINLLAIDIGG